MLIISGGLIYKEILSFRNLKIITNLNLLIFDFLTLKCMNLFFSRFSGHNLRKALFVYRLIGATLIGIFF